MNRRRIRQHLSLYLVMGLQGSGKRSAMEIARQALEGGVSILQLREKNAPLKDVIEQGRKLRDLCRSFHVPFIVNDRIDVALLLDADGVHVGQDDIPCAMARKLLGADKIIGVSAGTLEEAGQAIQSSADYLGIGAIYPTSTKTDAGDAIGTHLIQEITQSYSFPLVGIGGIHAHNLSNVITAGADGVAVISAITNSINPKAAAIEIRKLVEVSKTTFDGLHSN